MCKGFLQQVCLILNKQSLGSGTRQSRGPFQPQPLCESVDRYQNTGGVSPLYHIHLLQELPQEWDGVLGVHLLDHMAQVLH